MNSKLIGWGYELKLKTDQMGVGVPTLSYNSGEEAITKAAG